MKTMYDLQLNEVLYLENVGLEEYEEENGIYVRRVPGGWLYDYERPVFVPYNEEFKK